MADRFSFSEQDVADMLASAQEPDPHTQPHDPARWQNAVNQIGEATRKVAKAARRRRRFQPAKPNRAELAHAQGKVAAAVLAVFRGMSKDAASKVRGLRKITKAEGDDDDAGTDDGDDLPDDLNSEEIIDVSAMKSLADGVIPNQLAGLATDGATQAVTSVGFPDGITAANTRALTWAQDRAAELVGMKWVDGELVDNPNAEWAITQPTRDMLNSTINQALDEGWGVQKLADYIEGMPDDTGVQAFSAGRAMNIARTETIGAHAQGALEGYREANANGANLQKEWFADAEACDLCLDNVDDGPIDLDDVFSSGDDAPPAHPSCECSLIPSSEDDGGDDDSSDDDSGDEEGDDSGDEG